MMQKTKFIIILQILSVIRIKDVQGIVCTLYKTSKKDKSSKLALTGSIMPSFLHIL